MFAYVTVRVPRGVPNVQGALSIYQTQPVAATTSHAYTLALQGMVKDLKILPHQAEELHKRARRIEKQIAEGGSNALVQTHVASALGATVAAGTAGAVPSTSEARERDAVPNNDLGNLATLGAVAALPVPLVSTAEPNRDNTNNNIQPSGGSGGHHLQTGGSSVPRAMASPRPVFTVNGATRVGAALSAAAATAAAGSSRPPLPPWRTGAVSSLRLAPLAPRMHALLLRTSQRPPLQQHASTTNSAQQPRMLRVPPPTVTP